MHAARKRRIWDREGGICWVCKTPVPLDGPNVRYDHRGTLFITESDEDAGIFPIHLDPCDKAKTPGDLSRIAKTKRQAMMRLDVPRETAAAKGRGIPQRAKPWPDKARAASFPKRPLRSRNDLRRR